MIQSRILMAALACGTATTLPAATTQDLLALRDALAPGYCSDEGPAVSHVMTGGTLYEVPCANTAQDVLSVFVWESGGTLQPLVFPTAQLTAPGSDGPNWLAQEVEMFSAEPLASSPVVEGGRISIGHRIAPGLGEGYLLHDYVLRDGQPLVARVAYVFDFGYELPLWPASIRHDRLPPVPFDIKGYAEISVPAKAYADPMGIVADLETYFPAHPEEEGRPRLTVQMTQNGAQLAMEVEEKGWADDSVSGQAYRVLMQRDGLGWRAVQVGRVNLCYRGALRKSEGPCP